MCTPTRYGVLTGRYCWRSDLKRGVLNGYGAPIIERDRETVARALKSQGYFTAVIGKWHLGLGFQKTNGEWDWSKPVDYSPVNIGFDHSFVIPAHLAEKVVKTSELIRLRDQFGFERIKAGIYDSGQIDARWTDEIEKDFSKWLEDHMDRLPVPKEQIQELLKERTW